MLHGKKIVLLKKRHVTVLPSKDENVFKIFNPSLNLHQRQINYTLDIHLVDRCRPSNSCLTQS